MNEFKLKLSILTVFSLLLGVIIGTKSISHSNVYLAGSSGIVWLSLMTAGFSKKYKWLNWFNYAGTLFIVSAWGILIWSH